MFVCFNNFFFGQKKIPQKGHSINNSRTTLGSTLASFVTDIFHECCPFLHSPVPLNTICCPYHLSNGPELLDVFDCLLPVPGITQACKSFKVFLHGHCLVLRSHPQRLLPVKVAILCSELRNNSQRLKFER